MDPMTKPRDPEMLTAPQRRLGLLQDAAMLVLLSYLAYHQISNTGFFTAAFGPLEMLALYGPIVISLAAPAVRFFGARRDAGRPFDAATHLSLATGSLWLAIIFPFSFAHLADPLPVAVRFVIAWISNDIGRALLLLQVLIGTVSGLADIRKWISVRWPAVSPRQ